MTGKRIGYRRVSTKDQNPDRQLNEIPLDKIFTDFASAKSTDRPEFKLMMEYLREDDILLVHSMDRLARNVFDLKNILKQLVERKVSVSFVKENIQFSSNNTALTNLLLHVLAAVAEFEYHFIKERQMEGIHIAKKKGFYEGRVKISQEKINIIKEKHNTMNRKDLAKELGIARTSLYRYMKELGLT